jgi:hypothetical protein
LLVLAGGAGAVDAVDQPGPVPGLDADQRDQRHARFNAVSAPFERTPTGCFEPASEPASSRIPSGREVHTMKRLRTAAMLFSIAAGGALTLVSAQPGQADVYVETMQVQNVDSHLCLSLNPQDPGKGIQVVQEPCASRADQEWRLLRVSGGDFPTYRLQNVSTSMCLRAVSNRDFGIVDTTDCTSISNEVWGLNSAVPTEIASDISSGGYPCLDVYEDLPGAGNTLDVFHEDRTGAQFFNIVPL